MHEQRRHLVLDGRRAQAIAKRGEVPNKSVLAPERERVEGALVDEPAMAGTVACESKYGLVCVRLLLTTY